MKDLKRTIVKSKTTLNLHNKCNKPLFVTKTFLYCNTCRKSIQKHPIFCYIFIAYFCTKKCHVQKHNLNSEKI